MPTYEYLCEKCGLFDFFQSIKDDPLKVCPTCKGRKIKRQISSGAGIIFKGSGFYETDYRSDSYQKAAKADSSAQSAANAASTSDSKSTSKSDSKVSKKDGSPAA
ncbi:MAG: zinc ribbon domain-containing protein [Lentisphaerae bacterium]|jgi:putative FmdB family regulatory protein|nr:zinc ribbon domain-containing protein [Lentisphaerota bacterium]